MDGWSRDKVGGRKARGRWAEGKIDGLVVAEGKEQGDEEDNRLCLDDYIGLDTDVHTRRNYHGEEA